MPAPKGNKFWQMRHTHGRPRTFKTADDLWAACCEYFEWVEANPLEEQKVFHAQGVITKDTVTKMRAMTLAGLCLHMGVDRKTWAALRDEEDFIPVVTRAEEVIYEQKFTGASADLLNANIIARDLGLKEGHEVTGKGGGPIHTQQTVDLSSLSKGELSTLREILERAGTDASTD